MSYQATTIEQGREFFKQFITSIDIQEIAKKTTGFVATNIAKIVGENPAQNIDAINTVKEIEQFIPKTTAQVLEDILKNSKIQNYEEEYEKLVKESSKPKQTINLGSA